VKNRFKLACARSKHRDRSWSGRVAARPAGLLWISLLVFLSPVESALAASFDCAEATETFEMTICKNAQLSKADEEMAYYYRKLKDLLPADQSTKLLADQRFWLRQRELCLSVDASCLLKRYQERSHALRVKYENIAPLSFAEPGAIQGLWSTCGFVDLKAQSEFAVFAAGNYRGRTLNIQIDQSGHQATQFDVVVNSPDKPVALLLGAYEPSIWNIEWTKGTKIVAVVASGHHRQAIAGLPKEVPILISTDDNKGPCGGHTYVSDKTLADVNLLSKKGFGKPVNMVYYASAGKVMLGKAVLPGEEMFTSRDAAPANLIDKTKPPAGPVEIQDAVAKEILRPAAESSDPLEIVHATKEFRNDDYAAVQRNDRVIFSQYNRSGNSFEIVAFNFTTVKSEVLASGLRSGKYVAQSDKYLVVSKEEGITRPLVVIDRASGKVLKQLKLQRFITWARIEGDKLIAFQGGSGFSAGTTSNCEVLIFELPTLRILKKTTIVGGNDVQTWNGMILSLGKNLAGYDSDLNELFRIALPARKSGERYSCENTGPLLVYQNTAAVVANCGEIWVLDLPKRTLVHTIPAYSMFYAAAIMDGLLFTAPNGEPRQQNNAHVFDLATGKDLAVLPINATELFVDHDRLLAVEREFAKPSPMTVYRVNTAAIRGGDWREQKILSECEKAKEILSTSKDVYQAIDTCKLTGIEGLVIAGNIPPKLIPVAKQYALWMSNTLDLGRQAIPLLEALIKVAPDQNLERALANAKLTATIIEGGTSASLDPEARNTPFARVLEDGSQLKGLDTKNIFFGSFSNLFHFSGSRIYIGRYANGASIGVLDRKTFDQIGEVAIAPDDNTYQDNIISITSDKDHIYTRVEYRYEQDGRPNFFVIDKSSLAVIKQAQISAPGSLMMDGDTLLACGCHFTTEQTCKAVNTKTLETHDVEGKICIQNEVDNNTLVSWNAAKIAGSRFAVNTKNFLISPTFGTHDHQYVFHPKTGEAPKKLTYGTADSMSWPKAVEGNMVIVTEATTDTMRIKQVDTSNGIERTLFGVPIKSFRSPVIAVAQGVLFVGIGRDLVVYDLADHSMRRYIKDYIVYPPNQAANIDANQITRLLIDEGRLIALTFRGENSRVAKLTDLARKTQ